MSNAQNSWRVIGQGRDQNHNSHTLTWDGDRRLCHTVFCAANAGGTTCRMSASDFCTIKEPHRVFPVKLLREARKHLGQESTR